MYACANTIYHDIGFVSSYCVSLLGSSLTRCAVNRQQCCNQLVLGLVDHALADAVNNETIISRFTSGAFTTAEGVIEEMKNKTRGMIL